MLGVRITSLRRVERCRALAELRLPFPAAVAVRPFSVATPSTLTVRPNHEGDTRETEGHSQEPTEAAPGDPWAKLLAASQETEKAKVLRFSKLPSPSVFRRTARERRRTSPTPFSETQNWSPEEAEPPTDELQLQALPKGFEEMSVEEQQEELWLVKSEGHLGAEWEIPEPGKHEAYHNDYPPYSPPKVLGMLLRWRARRWTPRQWRLARAIASNRSLRLPVLTAQAMLRRHALLARRRGVALKIERYLGGTKEWKARLDELAARTGITEADIKQWLWILSGETGDEKLQRFFKSNCRKPLFLLDILLAKDKMIQEPATFVALLKYVKENYILSPRPRDELDWYERKGTPLRRRAMTWWHFLVFLYRLLWHCRESWPAAITLISRLVADYIESMSLKAGPKLTATQARSLVLNKALSYFAWPARVRPYDHMEQNWAAQRHLLRLAASAEPPLVIDQNGYRSVRGVLLALSKTKGEAKNADRAAKTWPPYRRALDGIDERRLPEDDLSRSVKAGHLVREAGYNDETVDRALTVLGGSTFGQPPTVQTRSIPPPMYSGEQASLNIYAEWAAKVRATRNAREAWMMFENPPERGLVPTVQVYAEMFEKLYARPVTDSPTIRPGDAKEVFPVYNGNLSAFEIARLTPPTPDELYDYMLLNKIRPSGHCLVVLLRNAPSKMTALRYLRDSPYSRLITALRDRSSWKDGKSLQDLTLIPPHVFNAWIAMLCRIHTKRVRSDTIMGTRPGETEERERRTTKISQGGSILEAIDLVSALQAKDIKSAKHDKLPWHTIMQALAGPKMLYSDLGPRFNVLETLATFSRVYERTTRSKGVDPVSFEALCLMIRKTLRLATFSDTDGQWIPREFITATAEIEKLLVRAHRHAVKAFRSLTSPVPADLGGGDEVYDELWPGLVRYYLSGRALYQYMMALACCGDQGEMVRLMDWVLDGWDQNYIREQARSPTHLDYHYIMRIITYFVEIGRQHVEPAEMERLRGRLESMRAERDCTWFWPEGLRVETRAISDAELDLGIIERWPRLRHLVTFGDREQGTAASLEDVRVELPLRFGEEEQPEPLAA
ncbi:hypothetical protein VTK56DRAFT_1397 [Thermocarpiscus australiensis]